MKITNKILHVPPYISTTWSHIKAMYVKDSSLIVALTDQTTITIPHLSKEDIESIFKAHATYLEAYDRSQLSIPQPPHIPQSQDPSFQIFQMIGNVDDGVSKSQFGFDNLGAFSSAMQHNPAQANMPDLPKEMIDKISEIARIIAPEEAQSMPKPESNCNCPYCQIARGIQNAIHGENTTFEKQIQYTDSEEEVSEADLVFQQWEIKQTGEKLYSVENRLDPREKYSVYLGHPVGCTCGKQGCEHVLAVLKS